MVSVLIHHAPEGWCWAATVDGAPRHGQGYRTPHAAIVAARRQLGPIDPVVR